jgi:flagellar biosynthesis/type III secretory pathway chaperone
MEEQIKEILKDLKSIEEMKEEIGEIPENTCPDIDHLIKENQSVWEGLSYLERNAHRYDSAEELVKDFPTQSWSGDVESIAEELRESNERLREIGRFWYQEYKDLREKLEPKEIPLFEGTQEQLDNLTIRNN